MKKKKRPVRVLVAVLTQGTVSMHVSDMITRIAIEGLQTKKYEPTIMYSKQTGVDVNRNIIAKTFLKGNYDFLLMMDDDNPPVKNPLNLLDLNKDVMIFPTLMYKGNVGKLAFNVFKEVRIKGHKDWQTLTPDGKTKMFKVDRGGSGCILIKRKVLKKIKAPFKQKLDKDGIRTVGEDMMFCDRAWKNGFSVWGHWDYVCSHYKEIDLLGVADLIIKARTNENIRNAQKSV